MTDDTTTKVQDVANEDVVTDRADVTGLIESLRKELAQDEAKAKAEQEAKIKNLEEKSFSKDEVKEMMKALLKEQSSVNQQAQMTQAEIDAMKAKLDKMSGSQVQTEIENNPFLANTTHKRDDGKVELTDEWVLKSKGII